MTDPLEMTDECFDMIPRQSAVYPGAMADADAVARLNFRPWSKEAEFFSGNPSSLTDRIAAIEAENAELAEALEAVLYASENCGESRYGGGGPTPWGKCRAMLAKRSKQK